MKHLAMSIIIASLALSATAHADEEESKHIWTLDGSAGITLIRNHEGTEFGGIASVGVEIPIADHIEWRTALGIGSIKRFPSGSGVNISALNGVIWRPEPDHAFGFALATDITSGKQNHEAVILEGSIGLEIEYRAYIDPKSWYVFGSITPAYMKAMPFVQDGEHGTPQISGLIGIGTKLTDF